MASGSRLDLYFRSRQFAVDTLRLVDGLPRTMSGRTIADQLARSASSQAANYREARRARSSREFVSKIGISIQEIEESSFWLEMILELFEELGGRIHPLLKEANELTAMFVASANTARRNSRRR